MDALLKETADKAINSRFPDMILEGRKQIRELLVRKELAKGEMLLKEGETDRDIVFVGQGMLRQFYYKNGNDVMK